MIPSNTGYGKEVFVSLDTIECPKCSYALVWLRIPSDKTYYEFVKAKKGKTPDLNFSHRRCVSNRRS